MTRRKASGRAGGTTEPTVTESAVESEKLGAEVAAGLRRGDVVLVLGEVGAGKTTFIRGACRQLGVSGPVTSPTFTLGQLYRGLDAEGRPLPVAHLDLYRIADLGEEDPGLLENYFGPDRIAFVEWPDAPRGSLDVEPSHRVTIRHEGGDRRSISVSV